MHVLTAPGHSPSPRMNCAIVLRLEFSRHMKTFDRTKAIHQHHEAKHSSVIALDPRSSCSWLSLRLYPSAGALTPAAMRGVVAKRRHWVPKWQPSELNHTILPRDVVLEDSTPARTVLRAPTGSVRRRKPTLFGRNPQGPDIRSV